MNSQARVKIIDPYFRKDGVRSASRSEYAMEFPVNNRWLRSISDRKKISIRKFSVYPWTNYVEVWAVLSETDIIIARAVWPTNGDAYSMLGAIEDQINTWLEGKINTYSDDAVVSMDNPFQPKRVVVTCVCDTTLELFSNVSNTPGQVRNAPVNRFYNE